ncbi:MAG TPA: hypothetical protein VJN92_10305 [Candidatus Acidoferrum sp.]|nr:hypothetical protein [Candidatus Acidoferrum sp.]
MEIGFDIEKYLVHSKKVDLSDLDFSAASRHPLTGSEIRCLTYIMDVESHTIVLLKGILSTCAITDPETTAFLDDWSPLNGRARFRLSSIQDSVMGEIRI